MNSINKHILLQITESPTKRSQAVCISFGPSRKRDGPENKVSHKGEGNRKTGPNKTIKGEKMRSAYKVYENEPPYFTTSTINQWIPVFTNGKYMDILIKSLRYCHDHKNLSIYAYVILDNHFHLVCQAPELSKTLQSLNRHTAKEIIAQLKLDNKTWILNLFKYYKKKHKKESEHQVWQEGFHPQQIQHNEMLLQKIEYIHYNPVKRGIIEKPEHWVYSSARDYISGQPGLLPLAELPT